MHHVTDGVVLPKRLVNSPTRFLHLYPPSRMIIQMIKSFLTLTSRDDTHQHLMTDVSKNHVF